MARNKRSVSKQITSGFSKVPNNFWQVMKENGIRRAAADIYLYYWLGHEDWNPSNRRISTDLGMSLNLVKNSIKLLRSKRLLLPTGKTEFRTIIYEFNFELLTSWFQPNNWIENNPHVDTKANHFKETNKKRYSSNHGEESGDAEEFCCSDIYQQIKKEKENEKQ